MLVFCAVAALIWAPAGRSALGATPEPQNPPTAQIPSPSLPPIVTQQETPPSPPELTIVLDAAHGGADDGARGPNGINEKDIVLALARGCRAELTLRGYRVVMTRDSDADPSFQDRAAIANQFSNAIFVTLHVASTGTPGTVRVYYDREAAPFTFAQAAAPTAPGAPSQPVAVSTPAAGALIPWRQAQISFDSQSHQFADLVQAGLAQKFTGSPITGISAAVRDLRSVAAPAIAIEISNISSPNVSTLESMSPAIAAAIAQSVPMFRPMGVTNTNPNTGSQSR
jgi:N-acetylmuramoyl-L-alanine amidase